MDIVAKLKNYADLIRLKSPTGVWLLFLPGLWVILMLAQDFVDLIWAPIFFAGAFAMRSAGCIINDIVDQKFDAKVERTKARPIASGKLRSLHALLPLISFLFVGFFILCLVGKKAIPFGIIMMMLIIIYPFGKRFLKYPQLILAIVFNSAALFASFAIADQITLSAFLVYLGAFFWIIYYDTIYAHQDKIYDKDLGLYSVTLTPFGTKKWLARYYNLTLCFWLFAGVIENLNALYYIAICVLFYVFYKQLNDLDLDSSKSCMNAFIFNRNIGFILSLAVIIGRI